MRRNRSVESRFDYCDSDSGSRTCLAGDVLNVSDILSPARSPDWNSRTMSNAEDTSSLGEPGRLLSGSPFLGQLGVRLLSRDAGFASLGVTIDTPHLRSRGIAHGGMIATLLDTAMGAAVSTRTPEGMFAVTAQLDVKFIRPAWCGEEVRADGEVCHYGAQTAVARGEIRTADGVLVAISTGTFVFVRDSGQGKQVLPKRPDGASGGAAG